MMRILHYIPSIDRASGGVGSYMQLLAKPLGKLADLHIATHKGVNDLEMENAAVHCLPRFMHGMRGAWEQTLDGIRPDVVHVNGCWMPACALAQEWAQQKGYKAVLTPHGMLEPWIMARHYRTRKAPALWLYQKRAVAKADCLHATAVSEKQNLLELGYNNRIAVVANGIDVERIGMKTSWRRKKGILFLSRIHVKKGIEFLLEAVASLKEQLGGYTVRIAGEGEAEYIGLLKQKARQSGIGGMVDFCGGVYGGRKWELFREADVFVLPTHSENFGIVVAEALACGTPVITTTGTPWQELEARRCGWWTGIGARATAEALRGFLALAETELEAMGRNGRRLVEENYSARKMAEDMVKLYLHL